MRILVSSPIPEIAAQISVAATLADIECEAEPSMQAFGSALFRDPDTVGVFWSAGPASAAETCRRLRSGDVRNILFAVLDTERMNNDGSVSRAMVLNAGADDAQHWPVDEAEIVARLRALHRREIDRTGMKIEMAGAVFYPARSTVEGLAGSVHLSHHESTLLELIASHSGVCVTKAMCMLALYQQRDEAQPKIVDVFVCKLRKKLLPVTDGLDVIETVWGQGYRFRPESYRPVVVEMHRRLAVVK